MLKTTSYRVVNAFFEHEQEERKLLLLMCKTRRRRVWKTDGDNNDLKKRVYGILLAAAVIAILLLTFQDSAGTVRLSEGLRLWLERFGIHSDFHSNAHLVLYFLFGLILSLFGRECGWRWWVILVVGCCVGVVDEGVKVFLPTREFDLFDLVKDWVGVVGAVLVVRFIKRREK